MAHFSGLDCDMKKVEKSLKRTQKIKTVVEDFGEV